MLDTLKIYHALKDQFGQEGAEKLAEILGNIYQEVANTVTREDFSELKAIVSKLAEAQERTVDSLTLKMEQLTEAQQRTEERLDSLILKMEQLTEAQQRTEERLDNLILKMEQLTEAQQRTEERLDNLTLKMEQLTEAQQRTEERLDSLTERVEQLAVAQQKTEVVIQKLTRRVDDISKELGGISNTIGYRLEDESFPVLKRILKEQFGIEVSQLYRRNIVYSSTRFDEINIYGEGAENGRKIIVIGESKAQFGPRDVDKFLKLLKRVREFLNADLFPLAIAYHFHPVAEEKLKTQNIPYFWSYQLVDKK